MSKNDFNADFFAGNRRKLREAVRGETPIVVAAHSQLQMSADQAYIFRQNSNFWYLCGIDEPDFVLVIDEDRDYLIAPERSAYQAVFHGDIDEEQLSKTSAVQEILDHKSGWKRLDKRLKFAKQVAALQPPPAYLEPYGIYTNPASRRLVRRLKRANPKIDLVDIRLHMARLRMIKSKAELEAMSIAIKHTAEIFNIIHGNLKSYANEADIAVEISQYFLKKGLNHAYQPIVANGLRAATLHYEANNAPLDRKKITLIDAGASYQRYCADLTRSYCAQPTTRQRAVYDAVLESQQYAIGLIKPGLLLKDYEQEGMLYIGEKLRALDLIKTIDKESVRQFAPHGISHFLGLDAHDAADYEAPLAPGMVLTVEPGIYIKEEQIGVRIEDNILVTDKGHKNLSANLPKDFS